MMTTRSFETLSLEEKIVFLKLFCKVIKSDGVIDDKEVSFLKSVARRLGVKTEMTVEIIKIADSIDVVKEAQKIRDRRHALLLIKELCFLSHVDFDMADEELDLVADISEALGIEEDKVVQINRWVLNNLLLAKAGRVILEEDDD